VPGDAVASRILIHFFVGGLLGAADATPPALCSVRSSQQASSLA
jgi:hypothetical protein